MSAIPHGREQEIEDAIKHLEMTADNLQEIGADAEAFYLGARALKIVLDWCSNQSYRPEDFDEDASNLIYPIFDDEEELFDMLAEEHAQAQSAKGTIHPTPFPAKGRIVCSPS